MSHTPEPFGYFKPEPFGWTDCAETDDDAIPLFDKAAVRLIEKQRDELLAVETNLRQQVAHLTDQLAGEKSNVEQANRRRDEMLVALEKAAKDFELIRNQLDGSIHCDATMAIMQIDDAIAGVKDGA